MEETTTRKFRIGDTDLQRLFGIGDIHLRIIEEQLGTRLIARGDEIIAEGTAEQVEKVEKLFADLKEYLAKNYELPESYVWYAISMLKENGEGPAEQMSTDALVTSGKFKVVPRTVGQRIYVDAIKQNDIVVAIGPAGTGKTYLAVAMAVNALQKKIVQRMILVRPAVEAGESLGFLPGDIRAKVDPYLRPVYDALHDMMPSEKIKKLLELGVIEIAPLAFMRGRTLNSAFVILDEAQNTTTAQMKMFLTRLGEKSKAVVTGDVTQIDLASNRVSGLITAQKILKNIDGIKFIYLDEKDVVRHRLVQNIIKAYENAKRK
ncbi:MAG: PhoH family protein [candidate division Zixibacteria bacterium]|nr:PhoH family protein [candidate division Zixibacteria bacterium]NIR64830.1 PhoH family protein [candidate division Zixibacteria bacterium]NIS17509.1 PhoH family protein [candidate division Zixibacteria bacterium]NIS46649.1 PhoH family protein [candidate division Zixibacteria bacterium]NIT53818.1 PhoH family protein [candidate division Zixibacteria bacterium]